MRPSASEFWDRRAANYDAQVGVFYRETYEMTSERMKKYLRPTDTVMDFACGTGIVTLAVAPAVKRVQGIDISGEMLRCAREKAAERKIENVTLSRLDIFDASLAPGSFDAVLACNVLLYVEQRAAVLARVRELLKADGKLLVVSDCLGEGFTRERVRKWLEYHTGKRPFVAFDTRRTLEADMLSAGFTVLEQEDLFSSPPNRFLAAQRI